MLYIAICDDTMADIEKLGNLIEQILRKHQIQWEIYRYGSAKQLLDGRKDKGIRWDIIFLDIILQKDNGIELGEMLRKEDYEGAIVYVSRTPEFAVAATYTDVMRYLLKPVKRRELEEVLMCVWQQKVENQKIIIQRGEQVWAFNQNDVYYIEAKQKGTQIYFERYDIYVPIHFKEVQSYFKSSIFARNHQSFLVHLNKIVHLKRYEILFDTMKSIPVSKRYYKEVKEKIMDNLMK